VQLTYLGYPGTTGLDAIPYRLTNAVCDPPGEPPAHTEELVRLPGCFCCYAPPRDAPDVAQPPSLSSGHVTFGTLHKLAKLNAAVLDLWCEVLRAVPGARLLVFRDTLRGGVRDRFRDEFRRRGIPDDRVLLEHAVPAGQGFLSVYRDIDLCLDAFPWGGHATACEGLWMGVLTLTLYGDRHAGRMVSSVLTQLGLPEWIARSPAEFVARAAELAADVGRLAELRIGLRQRMLASLLCDGAEFTRGLEDVYRRLWRRWAEGGTAEVRA
jgi:predicted O-linked N-acetylglucosamine transferase (SPINDLY family)